MLTVFTDNTAKRGATVSRRSFLQVGTCTVGGLSLGDVLTLEAAQAVETPFVKDISIVFLYFSGGASHIETFDPMMGAPPEIRSQTGEVATTIPGVTFGGTFPRLARAGQISALKSRAFWCSVDSFKDLSEAEKHLSLR